MHNIYIKRIKIKIFTYQELPNFQIHFDFKLLLISSEILYYDIYIHNQRC